MDSANAFSDLDNFMRWNILSLFENISVASPSVESATCPNLPEVHRDTDIFRGSWTWFKLTRESCDTDKRTICVGYVKDSYLLIAVVLHGKKCMYIYLCRSK
jgi:hypothetical protein